MNENFLVIGHSGFIGSLIYKEFRKYSKNTVGISSTQIDLTKKNSIKLLSRRMNANTVVIVAAAITREKGDTIQNMNTHINMISNIAAAIEQSQVKKCIFLSTTDVYGIPSNLPITEESKINPLTYYATAKFVAERLLAIYCSKSDLLIVRFNGVYGPGQKSPGYGPNAFISSIVKQKSAEIWGKGEEFRDNLFVSDLARAIFSLYKHSAKGTYNIATGKSITFGEMLKILKQITKTNFKVIYRKRSTQSFDQVFDISKFQKAVPNFSFTPRNLAFKKTFLQYE